LAIDRPDNTETVAEDPLASDKPDHTRIVAITTGVPVVATRYRKNATQTVTSGGVDKVIWQIATFDDAGLALTLPGTDIVLPAGTWLVSLQIQANGTADGQIDTTIEFVGSVPSGYPTVLAEWVQRMIIAEDVIHVRHLNATVQLAAPATIAVFLQNGTTANVLIPGTATNYRAAISLIKLA
jgi:hypothetical protein